MSDPVPPPPHMPQGGAPGQGPYGPSPTPPPPGYSAPPPGYAAPTNGQAVAGMVLGIASIALFFLSWIAALIGVVGLILSLVGLSRSKMLNGVGRGMAVAGVTTSAIGIVVDIVFLVVVLNTLRASPG